MANNYSKDELKTIGKQCSNRLPPASAVQAMFLYEMQRETDLERLFQGQMFRLARAEGQGNSQEECISELFKQIDTLRQELAAREVEQQSKVRMDAFQLKLNDNNSQLKDQGERIVSLEGKVSDLVKSTTDLLLKTNGRSVDTVELTTKLAKQSADLECAQSELSILNADVAILFEERDAMASILHEAKARSDEIEKQYRSEMSVLKNEICERIAKVEKQAKESIIKAERQALAQVEEAKQASHEYVAKVEQRMNLFIQRANARIVKVEQDAEHQAALLEKKSHSHVARVEQTKNMAIDHVEKKVNDRIEKIEQRFKEQIGVADEKANLLLGEVGKYKWMADLEKQGLQDITDSVNRMRVKFEDQLWDSTKVLQSQMQSQAEQQNERIAKLEDLVRALTWQSETNSPNLSQLLHVQAANGLSFDLSVPKGQPLVPYKTEHIRSFTPGKRWMT